MPSDQHVVVEVQEFYRTPYYDLTSSDGDFALVKLAEPVAFTDYVRPVCITSESQTYRRCQIAGWGHLHEGGV